LPPLVIPWCSKDLLPRITMLTAGVVMPFDGQLSRCRPAPQQKSLPALTDAASPPAGVSCLVRHYTRDKHQTLLADIRGDR
jgi:hypothetical protein